MSFPRSTRRNAWEAFLDVVRRDPVLAKEVRTFRTWKGETRSDGKPATRQYPYLLLEAATEFGDWVDTQSAESKIVVQVEMAVQDDPAVLMDFWSALERAVKPRDDDRELEIHQRFQSVGISGVVFDKASFGVRDELGHGDKTAVGQGQITLLYYEQYHGFGTD